MVMQTPMLMPMSIRENITLGHEVSGERMAKILEAAQLSTWVATLENGIDTYLGDHANGLSGGQAQRIAIARAMAKEAEVILLDERLKAFARETEEKGYALPDLVSHPGAGAAGGLGYGLMAYLGAQLRSGIDLVLDTISFDEKIKGCDFIVTGEGKSDKQTLMGKVPMGILHRAQQQGIPVYLLSGAIEDQETLMCAGFKSVRSINENDTRPLNLLMQKEVAKHNLKQSVCLI